MRQKKHANLVISAALAVIAGTVVFYASWLNNWLKTNARASAQQAAAVESQAKLKTARTEFRRDFLDPAAHLRLSEALFAAGRPVDAFYVMHGARALFGSPAFERAHALVVLYGGSHFLEGSVFDPSPEMEARLRSRLQQNPADAKSVQYLARIAVQKRQPKEALLLLDAGLAAVPDEKGLLSFRAQAAAALGDVDSAVASWARLAAAHPETQESRQALEELGRLTRASAPGAETEPARLAREALEELLRKAPDDAEAYATLIMALWGRGQLDAVRAMVAETCNKHPGHAGAAMAAGALALHDRQPEQAIKLFTRAWEKNPRDLYSASKLSQLYDRQRADPEGALPYQLALYRNNPAFEDGEPIEDRIRKTLDRRRNETVGSAGAERLDGYLASEDASLRAEACSRAGLLADARWIEPISALLDDDTEIVRHNADYALYQIAKTAPDAVRVRRDEWTASEKTLVRIRALNLFADLETRETFPLVVRALHDPVPAVRFFARVMVLDHYYQGQAPAAKARAEYLAAEKDPKVLELYSRLEKR